MVGVTTESHENPAAYQYVVTLDVVTNELMASTCPHYVDRNAFADTWPLSKLQPTAEPLMPSSRKITGTIPTPTTVTAIVSTSSRVSRAFERDEKNCRTNPRSLVYNSSITANETHQFLVTLISKGIVTDE